MYRAYICLNQENLKWESVVAAILPLWRWIIVPPEFFVAKPVK